MAFTYRKGIELKKLDVPNKICKNCGKEFGRDSCKQLSDYKVKIFCSRNCWVEYRKGENHPNWKGGFKIRPDGYIRTTDDKYIHRLVMEEHLGRPLESWEQVHHIDGNPSNNSIENLRLYGSNSDHRKYEVGLQSRDKLGRFI